MIDFQGLLVAPCITTFGQSAQLTFGGQIFALSGVFDQAYSQTDVSDGMPVTTVKPCLGINLAQVNLGGAPVSSLQGAAVTVFASQFAGGAPAADTEYIVQEARTDGHGWAFLVLNSAPVAADIPTSGGQDT